MLTPAFQEASQGFEGYDGFWSTIESAEPSGVTADPESGKVSYAVSYTHTDGSTSTDQVTLKLTMKDGAYLIQDEE
jgi:eukaryotic-like serine/threonine-protein kinase